MKKSGNFLINGEKGNPQMKKFRPFEQYSNWCYYDSWGSNQESGIIQDGTEFEILWPDETKTKEIIRIEESNIISSDHGHRCDIHVRKAHFYRLVNDLSVKIYVRGSVLQGRPI